MYGGTAVGVADRWRACALTALGMFRVRQLDRVLGADAGPVARRVHSARRRRGCTSVALTVGARAHSQVHRVRIVSYAVARCGARAARDRSTSGTTELDARWTEYDRTSVDEPPDGVNRPRAVRRPSGSLAINSPADAEPAPRPGARR